jgi:hypothetical protein
MKLMGWRFARSVFIHEDDQGQVELLPVANWRFCEDQLREVAQEQASGTVWTDIHRYGKEPSSLAGLRITARSMQELIGAEFIQSNRITTGDSLQRWSLERATAFSFGSSPVFFVHRDTQGFVLAVWLEPSVHSRESEDALAQALLRLGKAHPLLLVDRLLVRLADLSDTASVHGYIGSRSDHTRQVVESTARQRPWWKFR